MVRFTTKKIESLTLGERLKKMRTDRRLGLNDVSKSTRIQAKYLQYLEDGNYTKLPADVYVKGFLRSYAQFMGVSEKALIKQYEREQGIQKNIGGAVNEEKKRESLSLSGWVVTPKLLIMIAIILFVGLGFFYLYSEINNFVSVPRLVILKPSDGSTIESASIHVTGVAEKDAVVSINDQLVMVNDKGEFGEDVGLQSGVNTITVKAKNRFDKESVQSIIVNAKYDAPQAPSQEDINNSESFNADLTGAVKLEVVVNPNPTWLSISADGNVIYSGVLEPGSAKAFEAKESITVTSAKGNETFIKLNGKDLGALGGVGAISDVVFTAEGRKVETNVEVNVEKEKKKKKSD